MAGVEEMVVVCGGGQASENRRLLCSPLNLRVVLLFQQPVSCLFGCVDALFVDRFPFWPAGSHTGLGSAVTPRNGVIPGAHGAFGALDGNSITGAAPHGLSWP